ncbi:hypothetical protein NK718_12795 [Alsobacter sp. SYSU M60028]|uniref:Uncharacterized protein n=1 Tax=Alsobacter ponti TaxID=2962936 RepID=A0ABT1LF91_9HYPH|nr:hypothetical protein [Alsobacter ponti]MCP8939395.1 hypothetical protein [Alsobacter ponti]
MGRPRKTLPANGLRIISDLACRGVREVEVARALGMSWHTWKRIREEDQEAKRAWEEAKAIEHDALVSSLFNMAVGAPAEYDAEGNVVRAEVKRDAWAAAFLLKARHDYRDTGAASEGGADQRVAVVVNIPAPMSPEDYAKLVRVTPMGLTGPQSGSEAA